MNYLIAACVLLVSYLLGSIPTGLVIVKVFAGKDIRQVASGRTGGTNAMRAAGFWAGLGTAALDLFKSAAAVWIALMAVPGSHWLPVFAPLSAILGHNYSIFVLERGERGQLRLRGGAGGAPTAGGAIGLWPLSIFIIVPVAALILYFVGYASLATLGIGLIAIVIFAVRAGSGASPWQYVLYGLLAEILLVWALRPNIQRLASGTERLVGFRARKKKEQGELEEPQNFG
jgi:glycerol-3-phosphate acyltransferase PlsY